MRNLVSTSNAGRPPSASAPLGAKGWIKPPIQSRQQSGSFRREKQSLLCALCDKIESGGGKADFLFHIQRFSGLSGWLGFADDPKLEINIGNIP
jgi:hypothetical protein